ncbi:hypothetical protein MRY87_12755 [bacterium]|nr:hypothetical protein [bacterium]
MMERRAGRLMSRTKRSGVLVLFVFYLTFLSSSLLALPPEERFVRLAPDGDALQVAISTYQLPRENEVTLVSAIHIADEEYYEELNTLFSQYHIVLYELVAPLGVKPQPGVGGGGVLNALQRFLADLIGASLQLEEVDYSPSSFVHADLSFEDLIAVGAERGETFWSLVRGILQDLSDAQVRMQGETYAALSTFPVRSGDLMRLFFDRVALRRYFAEMLALLDSGGEGGIGFPSLEPYLLDARNERVMKVLRLVLKKRSGKRIAIFYGAAHMPDIESQLLKKLSAERQETEWLTAWDLSSPVTISSDR